MSNSQIAALLELKQQAWNALPDLASDDPADLAALARFYALCDACRIFGVN